MSKRSTEISKDPSGRLGTVELILSIGQDLLNLTVDGFLEGSEILVLFVILI